MYSIVDGWVMIQGNAFAALMLLTTGGCTLFGYLCGSRDR